MVARKYGVVYTPDRLADFAAELLCSEIEESKFDNIKVLDPACGECALLDSVKKIKGKGYKYGWTGIPEHLPNGSSINKQITYGEYLEKYKGIDTNSLFNAFIMPYNMEQNYFELTSVVGNIGEAVGDWRHNKKFYERIQGIVMDTRYLMYHYTGNPMKEKVALADCIEAVLGKGEVPPVGGAPKHTPVSYMDMSPKQSVSMVAESLNYNIGQEKK